MTCVQWHASQAHGMASRAHHCSRGLRYRSRYTADPPATTASGVCLSACARMTHSHASFQCETRHAGTASTLTWHGMLAAKTSTA